MIVFGGLIGDDAIWGPFETAWNAKLAAPLPGKPRLQRTARQSEFAGYSNAEAGAVTHDFRQIIHRKRSVNAGARQEHTSEIRHAMDFGHVKGNMASQAKLFAVG